ncbi:sugar phosphate isomerase/epimerase [Candidatus Poribacteria bacterium]|nr:sugar phosphate isomerase/epimerase [Candidatus Poribacteria bacterium]MYF56443.1 sugar phosphate isomerase/epimerase [Candidatus Poribacteria bacterium]
MHIGLMEGTIQRETLEETLDAVVAHDIFFLQYHISKSGPSTAEIRKAIDDRQIKIVALSGTYNMIDPDVQKREAGLDKLRYVAGQCKPLGTSVITLCTGSRDPHSMWRAHPDNSSVEAWHDLVQSMEKALEIAEEYEITLAIEPEVSNVIDSAQKARRLLDEMQSPYLKVVMDGANIFHKGELPQMQDILDEAFTLLGEDIVLAHAKDLDRDGEAGHLAAGTGLLDYDQYIRLLKECRYDGAVVLHGLTEEQVPFCVKFLQEKIDVGG